MEKRQHIVEYYSDYLAVLKDLVAINTVYFNSEGIIDGLNYCKDNFAKCLPDYTGYFDQEHNLI